MVLGRISLGIFLIWRWGIDLDETRRYSRAVLARRPLGVLLLFATGLPLHAEGQGAAVLNVVVRPECAVEATPDSGIGSAGTPKISFRYRLRAGERGGSIVVNLRANADAAGVQSSFQTTLQGPGTAVSGSAPTGTTIVIAQFGPDERTTKSGAMGTVEFVTPTTFGTQKPELSIRCE